METKQEFAAIFILINFPTKILLCESNGLQGAPLQDTLVRVNHLGLVLVTLPLGARYCYTQTCVVCYLHSNGFCSFFPTGCGYVYLTYAGDFFYLFRKGPWQQGVGLRKPGLMRYHFGLSESTHVNWTFGCSLPRYCNGCVHRKVNVHFGLWYIVIYVYKSSIKIEFDNRVKE